MKKIISRYYFIIAILLVVADQFFIRLLLHSDLAVVYPTLPIICRICC